MASHQSKVDPIMVQGYAKEGVNLPSVGSKAALQPCCRNWSSYSILRSLSLVSDFAYHFFRLKTELQAAMRISIKPYIWLAPGWPITLVSLPASLLPPCNVRSLP